MMFELESIGRWLVIGGIALAATGGLLLLAGRVPLLQQFGSLPGDIRYQSPDGRISCFVPIVSMLLLSVVLSVLLNVIVRFFNR